MGIVFNQLLFYINKYVEQSEYRNIRSLITKMTDINIVTRYTSTHCISFLENEEENNCFSIECCLNLIKL